MTTAQQRLHSINQIGTGKSIPKRGYYVYAITEDGSVCYIGKGKGNRVLRHFNNSSNQLLASRIRDNRNSYNWIILDQFEEESDSLDYEERLILNCKELGHKLYNKIHYASDGRYNSVIGGFFQLLKQFDEMAFRYEPHPGIISPSQRAELLLSWIKEVCSKLKQIPTYNGVPINELSFSESIQFSRIKITIQ